MRKNTLTVSYFARNISIVIGLVLIWRGIWYTLDGLDQLLFGGNHLWTALGGVALGLLILYLPDKDLRRSRNCNESGNVTASALTAACGMR